MGCKESKSSVKIRVQSSDGQIHYSSRPFSPTTRLSSGKSLISDQSDDLPNQIVSNMETTTFRSVDFDIAPIEELKDAGLKIYNQDALSKSYSTQSTDSTDSGIYDLDEEYGFVITEHSSQDLIQRVEREFIPVENLELLVSGQKCPRLLSGVQKSRLQEQRILQTLREEGLISKPPSSASGGLSFEIVENKSQLELPNQPIKLQKLEERWKQRRKSLTVDEIEEKLEKAEERRRQAEEEKLRKLNSINNERIGVKQTYQDHAIQEMRQKQNEKYEATLEKRELQLRDLRDKLKSRHQKGASIRLKKTFSRSSLNTSSINTITEKVDSEDFFT